MLLIRDYDDSFCKNQLFLQASSAFLKLFKGDGLAMQLEYVKEMPKPATKSRFDFSSLLGALFFTWIIELLFPVSSMAFSLVYW